MQSTSSRRGQTSITHLMSFSLPPRPQHQPQHRFNNSRQARRNPTWGLGSGYHAVDKARLVGVSNRRQDRGIDMLPDMYMPTTDLSSIRGTTTQPKVRTPMFILTGTRSSKFSYLQNPKMHLVQYVSEHRLLLEWPSVVTSFAYHALFDICIRKMAAILRFRREELGGRNVLSVGMPSTYPKQDRCDGMSDKKVIHLVKEQMWYSG